MNWRSAAQSLALAALLFFTGPAGAETAWVPPAIGTGESTPPEMLVLAVAQGEIGYREGPQRNQSKYGEAFGRKQAAWCMEFVTWCALEAETRYGARLVPGLYPHATRSREAVSFYLRAGRFVSDTGKTQAGQRQWLTETGEYLKNNAYLPHPGDLVWFCNYVRGEADHTAIVEGVSQDADGAWQVHVIEGNNPDSVARAVYALTDPSIYGYGMPVKRAVCDLRLHNRGAEVAELRERLEALGLLAPEETKRDVFTVKLRSAVKAFQKKEGLNPTGTADRDTWLRLQAAGKPGAGE